LRMGSTTQPLIPLNSSFFAFENIQNTPVCSSEECSDAVP
jgi:hypothetical protein